MSTSFIAITVIEAIFGLAVIIGFCFEEKFIAFEQWLWQNIRRIVLGNYRRWKRIYGRRFVRWMNSRRK